MKYEVDSSVDETIVTLDIYNSDLNLIINSSRISAEPLTKEGFAFMWAGARATHGAEKGKFCFEVKVIEHLDVSHLPVDEPNPHVIRIGFSVDSSTLQLGEDPSSYGYGGTGKISTNCQFKNFGPSFMAGDCILAVADMDSDLVQIGFAKNGNFIGWAYKVEKSELQGKALFPHVLSKNCSFEVNFGQRDEPYFKLPDAIKNYSFIGSLPMDQRIGGSKPPETRELCEMIMMCGLPGAGKSVWAADYSLKHPEKKYNILGSNNIIDKMKVMGLPRKRNYHGRWDVLIQMATKCLNAMFAIGSKQRRNFILDQTNVYPTAQRRKMRNFDGFKRIAVVVVPTEAEFKQRCDKRDREEGKEIPDSAVLEMKANFKLPAKGDIFDEVIFTELQRDEAEKLVKQYNEEGKAAMGPARKQFRPNEPMRDFKSFDNNKGSAERRSDYESFNNQNMQGPNSYGSNRGNYNSRGGFNKGRGVGNNSSFGGRDNARDSFDSFRGEREGFNQNFAYFESNTNRGGFGDNRSGRGNYENYRGNNGGRGGRAGFDNPGRGRGGYECDRGGRYGFDSVQSGRGGYDGAHGERGSYNSSRGGRGGYVGTRGGGRGSFDGARGSGRGSYDSARGRGRGSYDSARGSGRGSYDSYRGGGRNNYDSLDNYSSKQNMYGGYRDDDKDASAGGYDKSSRFDQDRNSYKRDYSTMENISSGNSSTYSYSDFGSDSYSATERLDRSYDSSSSNYSRRSSNRFQSSDRGTAARSAIKDSNYSSGCNTDSSSGMQSSYSTDYGYSSHSYGDYKSSESTTNTYDSSNVSSSYDTSSFSAKSSDLPQRYAASSASYGNKYSQGTEYSASRTKTTRWSAEIPQTAASADTYSSNKSESYTYPTSDTSVTNYQPPQTYNYQQGMPSNTASQQWMASSTVASTNPSSYGSAQTQWMTSNTIASTNPSSYGSAQTQWMQYSQQAPNQYYSQ